MSGEQELGNHKSPGYPRLESEGIMELVSVGIGVFLGWCAANIYNFFYILRLLREKINTEDVLDRVLKEKDALHSSFFHSNDAICHRMVKNARRSR